MDKSKQQFSTIEEYISAFPDEVQAKLKELRKVIKEIIPEATETISYQMPTFNLNGKYLVYFAAFKKHISVFPFPYGVDEFAGESEKFVTSKGTIQFPLDQPIPFDVVRKIVKYRVKESLKLKK